MAEAQLARKIVGVPHGAEGPPSDGVYGEEFGFSGEPIRMAFLGDSTSIGLGMKRPDDTPAVIIARGLAAVAERPVQLRVLGRSGARSADLEGQVDRALEADPDIACIFIGANDVTNADPARASRTAPAAGGAPVARGRGRGGRRTCPDLGTVRPIAQPLRWVPGAGPAAGRGPDGRGHRGRRPYGRVRRHPGAGVRGESGRDVRTRSFPSICPRLPQAAYAVLPSVCAALGLWPEPQPARGEGSDIPRGGHGRGGARHRGLRDPVAGRATAHGRWATLFRRRRRGPATPEPGHSPRPGRHSRPFGAE